MIASVIVIAKAPVPGRCKTRLSPPLTMEDAARLAEAALADTLASVLGCPISGRRVLAFAGEPGSWVPRGFEVVPQRGAGLDERLAAAFDDVGGPALLIGMDTPQVTPAVLAHGLDCLASSGTDAVIGPALDGGYWAIGLRESRPELFIGLRMSSSRTFGYQLERLRSAGLSVDRLGLLRDVDRIEDARAVARIAPRSRFASELEALSGMTSAGRHLTAA